MRVLFTSPVLEHPAAGGPQLRIESSIKALATVCGLDIIARSNQVASPQGARTRDFYAKYCDEFHVLTAPPPGPRRAAPIRVFRNVIRFFHDPLIKSQADFIVRHADRRQIDVVWFGYGNISFALMKRVRHLRPKLKLVCDTDSVWSRFVLRELPYVKGWRRVQILRAGLGKRLEERAWVRFCDVTTAVSRIDAEYYRSKVADGGRVKVFSNVIDVKNYPESMPPPPGFKRPCLYLAGTFVGPESPMSQAARWVLEDILPLVRKRVPAVHFYIVGRGSEQEFGKLDDPGVTVTGMLDSVLPYLLNASVALVPLKFESGTRFKILEAGACGVPIVSTTLGAEGIPVVDSQHLLMADEPAAFADAIVRVLEDPLLAARLAENCRALIRGSYSIESLAEEARGILNYLYD